jgi:hypothetical protein
MKMVFSLFLIIVGLVSAREAVSPVLERVENMCNGDFVAFFGYYNRNDYEVSIPTGEDNRFHGLGDAEQGQPTVFKPGRHRNQFRVYFSNEKTVWILDKRTSTASSTAARNACVGRVPEQVQNAAEDKHAELLVRWSRQSTNTHFYHGINIEDIELGDAIALRYSRPQDRAHYALSRDALQDILLHGETGWIYPLWYQGEAIGHITIERDEGEVEWTVTSVGNTLLSREIGCIQKSWPRSSGYNPFLVKLLPTHPDELYFSVPELGNNLTSVRHESWPGNLLFLLTPEDAQDVLAKGRALSSQSTKYKDLDRISESIHSHEQKYSN